MPEETIDPGLLEQTKNQIRKLVAEIADLAEADIQPAEFYVEFLNRVVAAVAASGGALWLLDGRGTLKLQHQLEFRLSGLLDGRARTQPHDALLGCMLQATQAQIIPPGAAVEGVPGAGNPTPFALILAPLFVDKQVVGLVEILMDPNRRAASQKSTLRFVSDLCDLAAKYLKNRQVRQIMSQQQLWNQLEGFSLAAHSSLNLKETAYAVANDGKRLIGCDRLSVALKLGGKTMVEAVSGQEIVEQRANLIRELNHLCKLVIQSGEDLVYSGDTEGFPPDLRDALEIYIDESGSKGVIITLLHKPETDPNKDRVAFGCLIAEQIGDELASTDAHARCEVVSRHASTALWNAQEHDKIPLLPFLKTLGSPKRIFRGRTLAKILAGVGAVLFVILMMAFYPWELTIEGTGSLLPEARRNIYAPIQGIISEVKVDHGDVVRKGQVLIVIDSRDLEKELTRQVGELNKANTQAMSLRTQISKKTDPAERYQLNGQLEDALIQSRNAQEMITILKEQKELMTIVAPQDGLVTTWEVRKNLLNRPVDIGQELIQIAATDGEWVLEVDVPDDDMGPVLDAQKQLRAEVAAKTKPEGSTLKAYWVAATNPEIRYDGYVMRVSSKAELVESNHVVKVTAGFTPEVAQQYLKNNQAFRPGAEVRLRIQCGKRSLAYCTFRDVVHVFYETVLFRWPFTT